MADSNSMDPDSGPDTQRTLSLQWKSYKLLQDPAIRRVAQKIYRHDGIHFSVPDSGYPPVGELRDPRPRRIWSRHTEMSFPLPKFKLDEYYVGPIPLKEVTFARLNDNIREPFLLDMCTKFGEVEEMEILFHPKTRKHLGLARVIFTSTRGAKDTVKHLHNTSVMGNIIHAQLDIKGQQRMKYYDLIVSGSYTPQTVPTGGKALSEKFQPSAPAQPDTSSDIRRKLSTDQMPVPPLGSTTPCSLETGFGEQRLDTPPSSLGGPYTPGSSCSSQGGGTPYTSRSGTPFSQDSGYAGGRHGGYGGGPAGGGFPAQDMLPSSSCSSSAVSSSSGFKPRYYDEPHGPLPQDPTGYHRGRPGFPPPPPPPPPVYPPYHNASAAGMHMPPHPYMPPSGSLYESPPVAERERDRERDRGQRVRERDRDSRGRHGASRRSSFHHQDVNSLSKSSYHSHHSHREERDGKSYRREGSASREHGKHRNHHHSHNHHGRRRDSRDRDEDYANSADPRYRGHTNSSHRSSNSMSPPSTSYTGYNQSKELPANDTPSSSRSEPSPSLRSGERSSGVGDNEYRSHHAPLHPPPPPPPLPPASVIVAAVAETLNSLDFGQDSPVREEQWTKPKRRPSTPPQPPRTPPPSSPVHASVPSSSTSPSSTSLPHHHPSSTASLSPPHTQRDSSSPEPDSTNESLPFVHHCSSLDSRIEMLLKEQKSKFSFLASDDEDEEKKEDGAQGGSRKARGEGRDVDVGQQRRMDRRGRARKQAAPPLGGGDGRKSPADMASSAVYISTSVSETPQGQQVLVQEEHTAAETQKVTGAHTPPTYNGERQPSPHSSGEDMEISDEDDGGGGGNCGIASSCSSPAPSSLSALPSQSADPLSGSPPDSTQHFGTSVPLPHMASYPPHLPPPPPPGYSLQPPPPPPVVPPPLPHMELHSEYPMPPHLYDYTNSVELMSQYAGTSFQMQAHMLSRLHQLREKHAPGTEYPPSYHLHTLPPPSHAPHSHHPYMDQDAAAGNHYDQDHRYMPPHMPTYPYPDPHAAQLPAHHPHAMPPPPHTPWPPHVMPQHYPSHYPPPTYGEQYPMTMMGQNPHEATVQLVLTALIDEMKNIMQRDLNRKMVENVAFGTFDEWWDRKERKAKPFQTAMRAVSVVRDEEKKEEKTSSRPREPLMSLVDWAKSGGMEGFSLRGALHLPSFKVKRKEPQELAEDASLKRVRPSTPPDEEDEDSYQGKVSDGASRPEETRAADRDAVQRRKRPKPRKPYDLDSEGEETSDESSSEKEEDEDDSEKDESEDEAVSVDSDDESLSSSESLSSASSSSSSSSSSSDEEDEEELEHADESEALDTLDESTMDSIAVEKEKEKTSVCDAPAAAAAAAAGVKPEDTLAPCASADHRPPSPPCPRPSSPILPPLKKRRKTVSFSVEESEHKPSLHVPATPLSPSSAAPPSLLLSPVKSQPPDQLITPSPTAVTPTPPSKPAPMLRPFASRPSNTTPPSASPTSVLTVPPPVRSLRPEEPGKRSPSPQTTPAKSPSRRGKESPRTPPTPVCLTVQNLPLDHASLVRVAYEEPAPITPAPNQKGRPRGRPRTVSLSAPSTPSLQEEDEFDDDEIEALLEQRMKLREQLGASSLLQLASASTPDLSVLAHVAAKMDAEDDVDSEETETSDEAEEQKLEQAEEAQRFPFDLSVKLVLQEHNYSKSTAFLLPPLSPASSAGQKRTKQDATVLLTTVYHQHCVQEAPEEVIGDSQTDAPELHGMGLVGDEARDSAEAHALSLVSKRRGFIKKEETLEKGRSKKRTRKDKENVELQLAKKQKQEHGRKQRKGKSEGFVPEEDVDVERLETDDLSSSDSADSDFGPEDHLGFEREEVRKSERLFLQEAGLTPSTQRKSSLAPALLLAPLLAPLCSFKHRSEFEQMTILYDIWNTGLDQEDMRLLRVTYDKLLQDDHNADWLNDTHWVPHTITNIPSPRRKKKVVDGQLRQHVTGCARSEGYYAISRKEKDVYLDLDLPEAAREAADYDNVGSNRVLSERRSEQRRLLSAIGTPAVMDSDLLKLNQLKFRKKKLRFGRSRIHEWGLFAMEPIAADEMVIEYVGQNIRQMVADNREKHYAQEGIGSSYLFRVDHDTIIDATKCGNLARFINHCCTPNCYAKVITIESQKKIVIYSKQPIAVNEEITYDYKFPIEENKIPCLCGTENCRGTLN